MVASVSKIFETCLTEILITTRPRLFRTHDLEFKNCFGAVAGYINGHIFISCGSFGIALRLPKRTLDQVFELKGVKQLKYFQKGHIKKGYAILPDSILNDYDLLKKLVDKSIRYVLKR